MISYTPLWDTMQKKGISTYKLIEKYKISSETIHRMKHNKSITTTKIDDLCNILDCKIEEIINHIPDKKRNICDEEQAMI